MTLIRLFWGTLIASISRIAQRGPGLSLILEIGAYPATFTVVNRRPKLTVSDPSDNPVLPYRTRPWSSDGVSIETIPGHQKHSPLNLSLRYTSFCCSIQLSKWRPGWYPKLLPSGPHPCTRSLTVACHLLQFLDLLLRSMSVE